MVRTLFFYMVFRKYMENAIDEPFFTQYNIFHKNKYFFFQSVFGSIFNHCQKTRSNQEQCSLGCSSPSFSVLLHTHDGPLQYFSTYFAIQKKSKFFQFVFPDYVISCDYGTMFFEVRGRIFCK